ncbi:Dam family site-specific DNA-(adenine-N6)-methyltransferase, partial [Salmonella enterica subsp. enterica serovar Tennessee]|nr:Dam family site-specific DNA-(adenine-N6)-methyltransferase [Salmonella enterica subsp. enterica serovar Tennessee]
INFYKILASDVEALIEAVKEHKNDEDTFYKIRSINPSSLSKVEQAARILYLNRTCFNGLYRVNRKGEFNVPYGHYKNPTICDEQLLRATSVALRQANIILGDYKNVLQEHAQPGDFIFLDP